MVEPDLANGNGRAGKGGKPPQGVVMGLVRRLGVDAEGGIDPLMLPGQGGDCVPSRRFDPRDDDASDPCLPCRGHDLVEARTECRVVQMAVGVGQHRDAPQSGGG